MSSCCLFESFRLRFVVPRLRSGSTFGWSARSNCRRRSLVSRDSTSRSISSLVSRYEKGRAETDVATSPETPALRTATGTAPRRCPRGSRFHTRFHSRASRIRPRGGIVYRVGWLGVASGCRCGIELGVQVFSLQSTKLYRCVECSLAHFHSISHMNFTVIFTHEWDLGSGGRPKVMVYGMRSTSGISHISLSL